MAAPSTATASSTTALTTRSISRSWRVVLSIASRLAATTTLSPSPVGWTTTRQRPSPLVAGTVAALPACLENQAASLGSRGGDSLLSRLSLGRLPVIPPLASRFWTR